MEKATQAAIKTQSNGEHNPLEEDPRAPQKGEQDIRELPLLSVRNTVLLPNLVIPLLIGRDHSWLLQFER